MFEIIFLLLIGSALVLLNYKAIMKEKKSFSNALNEEQYSISNLDLELGKLKADFAEDILQLQSEMLKLREGLEKEIINEVREELEKEIINEEKPEVVIKNSNSVRIDEIKTMLDEKLSLEEIAEKLKIGKGEVLLLKELYIK